MKLLDESKQQIIDEVIDRSRKKEASAKSAQGKKLYHMKLIVIAPSGLTLTLCSYLQLILISNITITTAD
jgi:hypothetical protein